MAALLALLAATNAFGGYSESSRDCPHQAVADFIRKLYAEYASVKLVPSLTDEQSSKIFAQSTLRLMQRDREVPKGEMGVLDFDPICDCQDYENIRNLVVTTTHGADGRVNVTARFLSGQVQKTVRFDIVLEACEWRIYDIHGSLAPSLRKLLGAR